MQYNGKDRYFWIGLETAKWLWQNNDNFHMTGTNINESHEHNDQLVNRYERSIPVSKSINMVIYNSWDEGEPSHRDQQCLTLNMKTGKWRDENCFEQINVVCQKSYETLDGVLDIGNDKKQEYSTEMQTTMRSVERKNKSTLTRGILIAIYVAAALVIACVFICICCIYICCCVRRRKRKIPESVTDTPSTIENMFSFLYESEECDSASQNERQIYINNGHFSSDNESISTFNSSQRSIPCSSVRLSDLYANKRMNENHQSPAKIRPIQHSYYKKRAQFQNSKRIKFSDRQVLEESGMQSAESTRGLVGSTSSSGCSSIHHQYNSRQFQEVDEHGQSIQDCFRDVLQCHEQYTDLSSSSTSFDSSSNYSDEHIIHSTPVQLSENNTKRPLNGNPQFNELSLCSLGFGSSTNVIDMTPTITHILNRLQAECSSKNKNQPHINGITVSNDNCDSDNIFTENIVGRKCNSMREQSSIPSFYANNDEAIGENESVWI